MNLRTEVSTKMPLWFFIVKYLVYIAMIAGTFAHGFYRGQNTKPVQDEIAEGQRVENSKKELTSEFGNEPGKGAKLQRVFDRELGNVCYRFEGQMSLSCVKYELPTSEVGR